MTSSAGLFKALKGRGQPTDFMARCPAHADKTPSLHVTGTGDAILVHCHAGCTQEAVIDALRSMGLWEQPKPGPRYSGHARNGGRSHGGDRADPEIEVVAPDEFYTPPKSFPAPTIEEGDDRVRYYRREEIPSANVERSHVYHQGGAAVLIKHRMKTGPKFLPYYRIAADGGGELWQNLKPEGFKRVPYVAPGCDPFRVDDDGRPLFWCEGEHDVDTLATLGFDAFTFGSAKDIPTGAELYTLGRRVAIPAHNDESGRAGAEEKAARCRDHAISIKVIDFPELGVGEDITDWMASHSRVDLRARVEQAPEWAPPRDKERAGKRLVVHHAADITPVPVEWVWPGRLAAGKTTLIGGDPGLGKSQFSLFVAATISQGGTWPCQEGRTPKRSVIIFCAEDGPADTIVPRLMAAGADPTKVKIVTAVTEEDGGGRRIFNLSKDLDLLEQLISEVGDVGLVIIDPVDAYIGGSVDSHKNAAVRAVLEPISELADRMRTAILALTHFSKQAGNKAIYRFIGSIAHVGSARVAFAAVGDKEDEGRILLLHAKNNLAPPQKGLAFRVEQRLVAEGVTGSSIYFEPDYVTNTTADEALAAESGSGEVTAKDDAIGFLQEVLAGGPAKVGEIEQEAKAACLLKEGQSISQSKPFRSARTALGVVTYKAGMDEGWVWARKMPSGAEDALPKERAPSGVEGTFGRKEGDTPPQEGSSPNLVCAQCGAPGDERDQTQVYRIGDRLVRLHEVCRRFWVAEHANGDERSPP